MTASEDIDNLVIVPPEKPLKMRAQPIMPPRVKRMWQKLWLKPREERREADRGRNGAGAREHAGSGAGDGQRHAQDGVGPQVRLVLRAVRLPQQAVDGRDVVVDLLDGAAAVFGPAGHGDQVLARFDEREVLRDGVDVREDGVDERILGADDRRQRIALPPGFRDDLLTLRVAAGDREDRCGENRRRTDCECLFHVSFRLIPIGLSRGANIWIKKIPCTENFLR